MRPSVTSISALRIHEARSAFAGQAARSSRLGRLRRVRNQGMSGRSARRGCPALRAARTSTRRPGAIGR